MWPAWPGHGLRLGKSPALPVSPGRCRRAACAGPRWGCASSDRSLTRLSRLRWMDHAELLCGPRSGVPGEGAWGAQGAAGGSGRLRGGGCPGSLSLLLGENSKGGSGDVTQESSPRPPQSPAPPSASPILGWQQRLGRLPRAARSKVNHFLWASMSPVVCFTSSGHFSCNFQPLALEQDIFFPGRLHLPRRGPS